jgi:hypothetical protein
MRYTIADCEILTVGSKQVLEVESVELARTVHAVKEVRSGD